LKDSRIAGIAMEWLNHGEHHAGKLTAKDLRLPGLIRHGVAMGWWIWWASIATALVPEGEGR
jgi:hypothetical protein